MSSHSVAEARNQLSQLIDRAMNGEDVIITRHGAPVVELKAVAVAPRPVTQADIDWVADRRAGRRNRDVDAATLVSQMRADDDDRLPGR